ncbi:DUF4124 domain-containing protein [Halioglobus sp. HI00S01]|uniref:DUF4124 domain-containing protein n=1 Tax=Halioglobus sp. HI00S01 TaxID=1822214 RepID=UPI00350E9BC0
MTRVLILFVLVISAQSTLSQTIYKCVDNQGKVEFSDKACANDAEILEIKATNGMDPASPISYGSRYNNSTSSNDSRSGTKTGPRGGKYYYTKNGTKRYHSQD